MNTEFTFEELADGQILEATLSGEKGVEWVKSYPESQKTIVQPGKPVYFLGIPHVIWWKGLEAKYYGFGLAIQTPTGWKCFYDSTDDRLIVRYHQLVEIGITHIFAVEIGGYLPDITLLSGESSGPAQLDIL